VGLGKTYVALAVASTYADTTVVVPATLTSQWKRVSAKLGVDVQIVSHEALSHGRRLAATGIVVVDEAHRLRNPCTRRYDSLARSISHSHLLLLTATPVVNHPADLISLLRLGLSDSAFAALGLPSLERAIRQAAHLDLSWTTAPAIIARSAGTVAGLSTILPKLTNVPVIRAPAAAPLKLERSLRIIDKLEFPCLADSGESSLLRIHLLYRLASSTVACYETARRHAAYINRAIAAAEHGELLTRRSARQIFASEHELQLELDDFSKPRGSVDQSTLFEEQRRLELLLTELQGTNGANPKAGVLVELLTRRAGRKTIVFASAVATALNLARMLRWHRLAVVGAGKAWIASGRISVEEALSAFAPAARGATNPPRAAEVSTLLATDLAAEGLDLQDADAVVHYDLPWTPLKLEQRIGRIARLGSRHATGKVWWFAPPKSIERRLKLETRIANKARCQLELGVPTTSRVGKSGIMNALLQQRERLGQPGMCRSGSSPGHAVVRGPLQALVAVNWQLGNGIVPELILIGGRPLGVVHDYAAMDAAMRDFRSAANSTADAPGELIKCLLVVIRARLAGCDRGSLNRSARRLARRLVRRAYSAGRRRDVQLVSLLDAVLNRLRVGVSSGAESSLQELLDLRTPPDTLLDWLAEQPHSVTGQPGFEITAAIFADGASTTASDQLSSPPDRAFSS
jgi:hypothetical protein